MRWRRLAAATAAGLLGIHACRVYDEADKEPSDEFGGGVTGGTKSSASTGGAPSFGGSPKGGSGGSGGGGGALAAGGGRGGGSPASSGGATGAVGSQSGGQGPGADGGDPGTTPSDGGAPADAGASNLGGSPDASGGMASGGTAPGSGGASGGPATGGAAIAPELIDDGEDANNRIRTNQGRNGYWSTFDAADGCSLSPASSANPFMTQAPDATGTGDYALHFVSSGGGSNGCGVNLEFTSGPVELYDASEYIGISFGARSEGAAKLLIFRVAVGATDPRFDRCDPMAAADSMMQCYDHFQTTVQLTTAWQEIVVLFADLAQEGWGYSAGDFDASELVAVQWVAKPGTANVWIDDVKFVGE